MARPTEQQRAWAAADRHLELAFAVQRNPGAYALLLGAGVSKEAGLPSAWDVQVELIRQVAAAAGEDPSDPAAWWRARTGQEPRYDDILERLGGTPTERQGVLRRFFEPDPEQEPARGAAPAHRAIARLVAAGRIRVIVTLNFDHLVENALREQGIDPTVVATPAQFSALAPLHAQRAVVVHLHGDYTDPPSMLNTADELGAYDPAAAALMRRIAEEYGLVLAGWSATWDDALRELLATTPNRFYGTWWIDPFPLSEVAARLRAQRGAVSIASGGGAAFGRLADAADAIEATAARHPRSAEVAVASAKRALQGRARAVGLHDELRAEFAALVEHPAMTERVFTAVDVRRVMRERIGRIEEATAVLVPLVATVAYWGSAETDPWWREEIPRLTVEDEAVGVTALTALQDYPAALVLTAAGVAMAANDRLPELHGLLTDLTVRDAQHRYLGASEVLALDRVLLVPGASRATFELLRRPFAGLLALGDRPYTAAWERFEYLQLLERLFARLPEERIDALREPTERAWATHEWSPALLSPGMRGEEVALRRALDDESPDDVGTPHLRGGGYGDSWYPRVSATLRRDLINLEHRHPLVLAGFCEGDLGALKVLVAYTDHAIGRAARSRSATQEPGEWLDG